MRRMVIVAMLTLGVVLSAHPVQSSQVRFIGPPARTKPPMVIVRR